MLVTIEEMKNYLRLDSDEDDVLVAQLITSAQQFCKDILRVDKLEDTGEGGDTIKVAIFYTVTYMYEHREQADYKELALTLRALLSGVRKDKF